MKRKNKITKITLSVLIITTIIFGSNILITNAAFNDDFQVNTHPSYPELEDPRNYGSNKPIPYPNWPKP